MPFSGLLVDIVTPGQNGRILSRMPLVRRDVVDASMLVLMVVPGNKGQPQSCAASKLAKPILGKCSTYLQVRNNDSMKALSSLTRGGLNEAVMPSLPSIT